MASEKPTEEQLHQAKDLYSKLDAAKISYHVIDHACAKTIKDCIPILENRPSTLCKNFFFKDKKGAFFLFTTTHDTDISVKYLNSALSATNLRLADESLLKEKLNILPGCVSPLAILNNESKDVKLVLDSRFKSDMLLAVHPLHNFATIEIQSKDLIQFIESNNTQITFIEAIEKIEKKECTNGATNGVTSHKVEEPREGCMLGLSVKKYENFPEWYTQAITRAELVDYYDISGCYIIRPLAYSIWETLQQNFDKKIKYMGVDNCYFPMFVSKAKLETEKDHVEGFSPEVAWVTHYGDTPLPEKIAIRPTSETIMYPAFAKWIRSHRDLPLKLNQWCSVVRWEFKQPTPFLRTREFLWQEGHTAHSTEEEAMALVLDILELYRQWFEDMLAVPVIKGEKSEYEKFAGGKRTTTVEAFIPANGRAIQAATSHLLGQNFAKMFEIEYEDEAGQRQLVHQTSWGVTTRSLGVMVMTHGDDKGLILPPRVAPTQVVIIPILFKEESSRAILDACESIALALQNAGVRAKVDSRENYTPGWKYNHWELKGIPLRVEIGPRDLKNNSCRCVRRDTAEAIDISQSSLATEVPQILENIQKQLFTSAKQKYDDAIEKVTEFSQVMDVLNRKHIVLAPWCEDPETEKQIKAETQRLSEEQARTNPDAMTGGMKSLCIPFDQPKLESGTKCFFTGRPATRWALFGRSY